MHNWMQSGNPGGPSRIIVFCSRCGLENKIVCQVEFGMLISSSDWCSRCGKHWEGTEPWYVDHSVADLEI